jgi:sarcosine/dimethylglycine N-methyltransferase
MSDFTEQQTRDYYNKEDAVYQSLWSSDGNLHWGYFINKNETLDDAMRNLNERMLSLSSIVASSNVLDLGCGNGVNSFFTNKSTKASVVGLDLSDVRIENAKNNYEKNGINFLQASATDLPFEDETFSHVFSQSTLYHVHDKEKALEEVYRVLRKGGVFIFEDIVKPKDRISDIAREHVYDRLLFDTNYNADTYKEKLKSLGFEIEYIEDMSHHFAQTYDWLTKKIDEKIANKEDTQFHEAYKKLKKSYSLTSSIVEQGEVGWILIKAIKK